MLRALVILSASVVLVSACSSEVNDEPSSAAADRSEAAPVSFTDVTVGTSFGCGLSTHGSIECWGSNYAGQADAPEGEFTQVVAGSSHACALDTEGSAICWGQDGTMQASPPDESYVTLSASGLSSCGITTDAVVMCWGNTQFDDDALATEGAIDVAVGIDHVCALGEHGTIACEGSGVSTTGPFTDADTRFIAIDVGELFTCALEAGGAVACWDRFQQLPMSVPAGSYTQLQTQGQMACVLDAEGSASCWLPDSESSLADAVTLGSGLKSLAVSSTTVCGVESSGRIRCWGEDPAAILSAPSGKFIGVSSANTRACAISADHEIACWGNQLPTGGGIPEGEFSEVSVGFWHSCGLRTDQTVACWGSTWNVNDSDTNPLDAGALWSAPGPFETVSTGTHHACGLRPDGAVDCWSFEESSAEPYVEAPTEKFQAISSTLNAACGVLDTGALTCWDIYGFDDQFPDPIYEVPEGQFTHVAADSFGSCALRTSGEAACWGTFFEAEALDGDSRFIDVAVSNGFACAVGVEGDISCWPIEDPELGSGVLPFGLFNVGLVEAPEMPPGEFSQVSVGFAHVCALAADGTIACRGSMIPPPAGVVYGEFPTPLAEQRIRGAFTF